MLELNKIYNEDCLEGMKKIPDGSVDMILCDLPYGTMKNAGLDGWVNQTTAWDEQLNIQELFKQYERVCRECANIILFSQEPYTSTLRSYNPINIEFAYPLIWKKDHFANALISKKAPVSYFEDLNVFYKKYDIQNLNPLRKYFGVLMKWLNFNSCRDVNKALGHRKAEHTFYIDSTQFKLCTKQTYEEMIDRFKIKEWDGFKTFTELQTINEKYQKVFNLPEGKKFIGNVLEFKKDYQGLHPTQKPVALLEFLINTYSNENELILDNCMGSGSTAIACINTNRNFIGFELEENYYNIAQHRINDTYLKIS